MKKIAFGIGTALVLCSLTAVAAPPDNGSAASGQNEEKQTLNDPAFQYPYAAHSAGIELCPGIRSGASLRWFFKDVELRQCGFRIIGGSSREWWVSLSRPDMSGCIFIFATETRPDRDMLANLGKGETRGGLFKLSTTVRGDTPSTIIAKYKEQFPDLKHQRSTKSEIQKSQKSGITIKVKNIAVIDKLSSDKVEILINSQVVNVAASGDQPKETLKQIADLMTMDLMRDIRRQGIQVIITDKVLEQYFATLRNASAAK